METFPPNDKSDYYFGITNITVNGKNAYELKGKFLDDLHNNAFSGTNGKDAVEHIEYFLKIVDPIILPNVDHDKPRIVVFPISLAGGGDEIKVSDNESSDLEEYWSDKEEETAEIFKIETDIFDYQTPLCLEFNEFNYLLKVDPDLLTKDTMGFKTYEDYKDYWIYEWNKNVPWVYDKPWLDNGIRKEPTPVKHYCKPFNYKTGCSEWPTCTWREDGYCNGGNLPGAYLSETRTITSTLNAMIVGEDGRAMRLTTKIMMKGNLRRYKMIKYSFNNDEKYATVKEDEYGDLTLTREEACRAYQEIFRMMDGYAHRMGS
nr:hypothetical protein [Tanacetum cinerariifolium]